MVVLLEQRVCRPIYACSQWYKGMTRPLRLVAPSEDRIESEKRRCDEGLLKDCVEHRDGARESDDGGLAK